MSRALETPQSILEYWFGSKADDAAVAAERSDLWWSKNAAIDEEIRRRFETLVLEAGSGKLDHWSLTARTRLALILLTDQFPRNIYRDSARAFAFDAKALAWCLEGINEGLDRVLRPIERVFFYLPLEHEESLQHQQQSVNFFRSLADSVRPDQKPAFDVFLNFAVRHRNIIERFGRFPHRNKMLGRQSTPEELTFLAEAESSF